MKKLTIIKTAKALCAAMALSVATFTVFSCNNLVETEFNEKSASEKDVPVLHINLNNSARTIMPMVELSELTDFVLYGVNSEYNYASWSDYTGTKKTLGSYSSIQELQNAEIYLARSYDNTTWRFYLTAKKGNSTFAAITTAPQKVVIGDNALSFALKIQDLEEGKGSLNFTVDYSQATDDSALITKATCNLYIIDSDGTTSSTATESIEATAEEGALTVSFAKDELASGCYKAYINLYSDNLVVGSWFEVIQISDGVTSGGTISIPKLAKPYTFNFDLGSVESMDASKLTFDSSKNTVLYGNSIPTPKYSGLLFVDWYTDSAHTQVFSWDNISTYTPDQNGSYTVYARWINPSDSTTENIVNASTAVGVIELANVSSSTSTTPYSIKAVGPMTTKQLNDILTAMNAKTSGYFSLDLRDVTGLENLASASDTESRFTNSNLVTIKLPSTVKTLENAFSGCSALKEIVISSANPLYKDVNGVVLSKDGTVLYVYPAAKTETSYTTPDGVKKIASGAFANVKGISSYLYISTDVVIIEPKAFYGASMITISIKGSGSWYKSEKELTNANDVIDLCNSSSNSTTTFTITDTKSTTSSNNIYYFYKKSLKDILQMDGIEYVDIYNDSSFAVDDGTYTITTSIPSKYFKLRTVEGTKYIVNWVDSYTYKKSAYTGYDSLGDWVIKCYDSDMNQMFNNDDYPTSEFTAKGDITIIEITTSTSNSKCAFRVKVAN